MNNNSKIEEQLATGNFENKSNLYEFPASNPQQQLWFLSQIYPGSPVYNIPFAYDIRGELNINAFRLSINEIINRHETFRTIFASGPDGLKQYIHSNLELDIPVHDLSGYSKPEIEKNKIIDEYSLKPFDVEEGPLIRSGIIKLSENHFIVLFTFHHIILDHTSILAFTNELTPLYNSFKRGMKPNLKKPLLQYADFVMWQKEEKQKDVIETKISYWKNHMSGNNDLLELPYDKPRPAKQSLKGKEIPFFLSKSLSDDIKEFTKREKKTLFMTYLSAFKILLQKYSGQEYITIGCPFANRNQPGLESVMGCIMNTLPLKTTFSDDDTFRSILNKVRETTIGAQANQEVSFEQIVEELQPIRDYSYNPLFQVSFMFQDAPMELQLPGLVTSSLGIHNQSSKFDLTIWMWDSADGIKGLLEYSTDLFCEETIQRLLGHYKTILEKLVKAPELKLSSLNILTKDEECQIIYEWNKTEKKFPVKTLPSMFEDQVFSNNDSIAAVFKHQSITYGELNERSNQLANYLLDLGLKTDDIVGVCLERSLESIIALLAILKAGGAYLPLDHSFPIERLDYMIKDSNISFLITHKHLSSHISSKPARTIFIVSDWERISQKSIESPGININPNQLAYIIYTSGSTGKPKGVQIQHKSVVNFLYSMQEQPGISKDDVLLSVTTLSFDIAALEIFLPLVSGARTVVIPRNITLDGKLLAESIKKYNATMMQATPATYRLLIESGWRRDPKLKILCGGEALPDDLKNILIKDGGSIWNMYGPTETCIWSSVKELKYEKEKISIGRPIANTTMYILDKNYIPLPVGIPGELFIGGEGLSAGYLNRPELNKEKFITNPFETHSKIYRTGDLARYLPNGEIECIGRTDFQVKIRGFRIELGEIEALLNKFPEVKESTVISQEDVSGSKYLAAFIISKNKKELLQNDIRNYLKSFLPDYMIPSKFVFIDKFPLTLNGKIDRKILAKMSISGSGNEVPNYQTGDALEMQLRNIWENVLQVKPIGINDNFFEIGGHSLLAARLFAKIDEILGIKLPLSILFQASTIKEFAEVIRTDKNDYSWDSLVPIQPGGTNPILYCVHGAGGNVLLYRDLAKYLGEDQPVYGLQSIGLNGMEPSEVNFEAMASFYIKEIKSLQPEGPYYLSGYCLGGAIAFEMARQLEEKGDKVALLAMFETYNIQANLEALSFKYKIAHKLQNLFFHFDNFRSADNTGRWNFLRDKLKESHRRWEEKIKMTAAKISGSIKLKIDSKYPHYNVTKMNDSAQLKYKPKRYKGNITLFRPKKDFIGFNDPLFGWGGLAKNGVEVFHFPVNPRGMLVEPFVKHVAEKLKACINEAIKKNSIYSSLNLN